MTLRLVNAFATNRTSAVRIVRRINFSPLNEAPVQTAEQQTTCAQLEARMQDIENALFRQGLNSSHAEAA